MHTCRRLRYVQHSHYVSPIAAGRMHRVFGLNEARVDLLARKLRGEPRSGGPRSDRLEFINGLQSVPMDAQAFDDKFSKTVALELSKTLTYMPV